MSTHPAYAHVLAQLLVGAELADQLRAGDQAGYQRLLQRVRDLRRAWWTRRGAA